MISKIDLPIPEGKYVAAAWVVGEKDYSVSDYFDHPRKAKLSAARIFRATFGKTPNSFRVYGNTYD